MVCKKVNQSLSFDTNKNLQLLPLLKLSFVCRKNSCPLYFFCKKPALWKVCKRNRVRRCTWKTINQCATADPTQEKSIFKFTSPLLDSSQTGPHNLLLPELHDEKRETNHHNTFISLITNCATPTSSTCSEKNLVPEPSACWYIGSVLDLWVGPATTIFRHVRVGFLTTKIHGSAWTDTSTAHSYISLKLTPSVDTEAEIPRSQREAHYQLPVSPWTIRCHSTLRTKIEVRRHERCRGRYLQYMSWSWDLIDGTSIENQGFMLSMQHQEINVATADISLSIEALRLDCRSTRCAACFAGYKFRAGPQAEQSISCHSWIASDLEGSDHEPDNEPSANQWAPPRC